MADWMCVVQLDAGIGVHRLPWMALESQLSQNVRLWCVQQQYTFSKSLPDQAGGGSMRFQAGHYSMGYDITEQEQTRCGHYIILQSW